MRKLLFAFLLMLVGGQARAAGCPALPYTLTNGTVADATQVMANLDALLNCLNNGAFVEAPGPNEQFTGPGGGTITMQNPSATANYNYNLPATAGSAGQFEVSGGGAANPNTWGTFGSDLTFSGGILALNPAQPHTWTGAQSFGQVIGKVSTQAGTSYTLAATDCGTTITFTNVAAVTVTTLNSLPVGCSIAIEQGGAGQITIAAGTGATQHSAHGYTKTYGQYAIIGLFVDTNAGGSSADIIITGDGA